jgi:4-coumarate--CoA ligase
MKEGEVVSICSPNTIFVPVALFGIMHAGGIAALSSPAYGVDEMVHVLKTVGCRFVMSSLASFEVVKKAAGILGIRDEQIFVLDGQVEGFKSLGDLVNQGKQLGEKEQMVPFRIPLGKMNSEICAVLCFSSGTTGLPKAVCVEVPIQMVCKMSSDTFQVMISHQNIIAQCLQLIPTTSGDHKTVLGLLPFYHSKQK